MWQPQRRVITLGESTKGTTMLFGKTRRTRSKKAGSGGVSYPISRGRYYVTEVLFVVYMLLWFGGWYLIVKTRSKFGVVVTVVLFVLLLISQPTGIPFEPYEKAMRRMAKLRGYEGDARGGEGAGGTMGDGAMDDTD